MELVKEQVKEQVKMKMPAEAVELYTRYIHGEVSRRDFLEGLKRFAVAGLTVAAIVEALMPHYALGQQVRKRAMKPYRHPTEMGTSRVISPGHSARIPVLKIRRSCLLLSSYTRIGDSIRIPRTSHGGSRWRTSWHLRLMR